MTDDRCALEQDNVIREWITEEWRIANRVPDHWPYLRRILFGAFMASKGEALQEFRLLHSMAFVRGHSFGLAQRRVGAADRRKL